MPTLAADTSHSLLVWELYLGGVVVFGELGALGLVLPRVALEVGERVERRRREPGEEGQRADGEAGQSCRDRSDRRYPPEPALIHERHVRPEPEDADDEVSREREFHKLQVNHDEYTSKKREDSLVVDANVALRR